MKDCICGRSSHILLGFHLSEHSHSSLLTFWRGEITLISEELGSRDFYSCTHTLVQLAAFRGEGEGIDVWKSTTDIQKIICQTACWSSLINLTFPSMFHEEAGISQLDKRWQLPGMEAVQQVGLAWAPIVCDGHADWPHHLPVLQCPQCTGSSPNTSDTVTGCEALSAVLCCSRAAIRNHAVHCIKIEIAALVQV